MLKVIIGSRDRPGLALKLAKKLYPMASIYDYDTLLSGKHGRAVVPIKDRLADQIKKELVMGDHDVVLTLRTPHTVETVFGKDQVACEVVNFRKTRIDKGVRKLSNNDEDDSNSRLT